jgi:hypothetical protein
MNLRELIIYQIELLKRKYKTTSGTNTWIYVAITVKARQREMLSTEIKE